MVSLAYPPDSGLACRSDGWLELWVRDDGQGIPPAHRERVFGVFERLYGPSAGDGDGTQVRMLLPAILERGAPG